MGGWVKSGQKKGSAYHAAIDTQICEQHFSLGHKLSVFPLTPRVLGSILRRDCSCPAERVPAGGIGSFSSWAILLLPMGKQRVSACSTKQKGLSQQGGKNEAELFVAEIPKSSRIVGEYSVAFKAAAAAASTCCPVSGCTCRHCNGMLQ